MITVSTIQTWFEKLSKQERYLLYALIAFIIFASLIFLELRGDFFLYNLLIGILIFGFSLYFSFLIFPRKRKVVYLYGDSRSNKDYYGEEKSRTNIDLRSLDEENVIVENMEYSKSKISTGCAVCNTRELLPYICKLCGKSFCIPHRLPEKHSCDGI